MRLVILATIVIGVFYVLADYQNYVSLVFKSRTGEVCGCARPGDYSPRKETCDGVDLTNEVYEVVYVKSCF